MTKKVEIKEQDYEDILKLLTKQKIMNKLEAEAWCYALREIEQSINKIYIEILPKFQLYSSDPEKIQDIVWDIREEFRHIQYHIDDGNLKE